MRFSRRNFLRLSGTGLVASQAPGALAGDLFSTPNSPVGKIPFTLGIASYTLREFNLEETIKMTNRLDIKKLALKSMHMPLESTPEEIQSIASRVREAGIDLYGAGVIYMKILEYCNKKVKETGIKLAIHNHGPGDKKYPSPESAYVRIKEMAPGMGLCVDIGHTIRIGLDPATETAKYFDRVHDIHIKDVDKAEKSGANTEVGRGVIDIPGYLKMLIKKNYQGVVSFEYEKDGKDPLPGLAESVGYVRGVLKMLT
ncbi:MAG: sugar phosphate isomerase/epimerase [Bacteroidales bacterium]|nr:sugar phosphate isomerase/epimerase [Bacteroidales bacterium]